MWKAVVVPRQQRVAHLCDNRFVQLLKPGRHTISVWSGEHEFVKYTLENAPTEVGLQDPLPLDTPGTEIVRVGDRERVAVFVNDRFVQFLGPGTYRWWTEQGALRTVSFDIHEEPPLLEADGYPESTSFYTTIRSASFLVLWRDQRVIRVLSPGRYRLWNNGGYSTSACVPEVFSIENSPWYADSGDVFHFSVAQHEVAVVWRQGKVLSVHGPGRFALWRAFGEPEIQRFDHREEPTTLPKEDPLPKEWPNYWSTVASTEGQAVVLCRDKQPYRLLEAGRYRVFNAGNWSALLVGLGLQTIDVAPQDLLTQDQVPVRLKPAVALRVVDPLKVSLQPDWTNQVYTAVQIAMREVVTSRTLETVLSDRKVVDSALVELAQANLPDVGVALVTVSVKDVILPGEIKDLLNRVTLAKKEAEALAIKRREETSQTRQLANTARLLESNPVLLRLKELEALGEIAGKIDRITLVGSGDMVKSVLLSDLAKNSTAEE